MLFFFTLLLVAGGALVSYIIYKRSEGAHSRKLAKGGEKNSAPSTAREWKRRALLVGGVIAVGLVVWLAPEAPTVGTVGVWSRQYWLWLLIALVAIYVIVDVFLPKKWQEPAKRGIEIAAAVLVLSTVWSWVAGPSQSTTPPAVASTAALPSASLPQGEWLRIEVPPLGESGLIPRPPGSHLMMASVSRFTHVSIYQDGSRCSYPNPCPTGSVGSVAKNLETIPIIVSVAVAPD
ncbi:hypothetical protein KGM48_03800 [Patescibacteria group bacterium]|nr:hypothetical protein [Patescibacteria group bacterium]